MSDQDAEESAGPKPRKRDNTAGIYMAGGILAGFGAFFLWGPILGPIAVFLGIMARVEGEKNAWIPILLGIAATLAWFAFITSPEGFKYMMQQTK